MKTPLLAQRPKAPKKSRKDGNLLLISDIDKFGDAEIDSIYLVINSWEILKYRSISKTYN